MSGSLALRLHGGAGSAVCPLPLLVRVVMSASGASLRGFMGRPRTREELIGRPGKALASSHPHALLSVSLVPQ